MQKLTLSFPDNDSLWRFKETSKAINIRIEPKRHLISGLFSPEEVDFAVKDFQAVQAVTSPATAIR